MNRKLAASAHMRARRSFLAVGIVILTLSSSGIAAADDPMTAVKNTVNQALPILRDKQTPLPQRQQKLREIIAGTFDFTEMAKSALGYHWKQLTPDQQKEFTQVFITFIENSYLAKINEFSNQQVQFLGSQNDGAQYAVVKTALAQPGQQPIAIDYRLLSNSGQWKIYDVTVDSISIIANYRNQFNRVMNNKGYDVLIQDLKSKEAGLAASMGS